MEAHLVASLFKTKAILVMITKPKKIINKIKVVSFIFNTCIIFELFTKTFLKYIFITYKFNDC